MIAVCDHNSTRNSAAVARAALGKPLTVLSGLEVTTSEEIHIVTLFSSDDDARRMQDEVYARLPGRNNEEAFGCQAVVDEFDQVEDLDDRLLIGATTLPIEKVVELAHREGGLAIASHVDRSGFGIFGQLGFIPKDLRLDGLEVSRRSSYADVCGRYDDVSRFPLVTSSDAHYPDDIGCAFTVGLMADASFHELRLALTGTQGRRLVGRRIATGP